MLIFRGDILRWYKLFPTDCSNLPRIIQGRSARDYPSKKRSKKSWKGSLVELKMNPLFWKLVNFCWVPRDTFFLDFVISGLPHSSREPVRRVARLAIHEDGDLLVADDEGHISKLKKDAMDTGTRPGPGQSVLTGARMCGAILRFHNTWLTFLGWAIYTRYTRCSEYSQVGAGDLLKNGLWFLFGKHPMVVESGGSLKYLRCVEEWRLSD